MTILNWLSTKCGSLLGFLQNFRLNNEHRIKLIENLLVISSILTFKLPNYLLGIFIFVIISSIVYWIISQKNQPSYAGGVIWVWATKVGIALAVSFSFSYIVVSLLYLNYASLPPSVFTIGFSIYFITLFSVLSIALIPEPPKE